VLVIDEFGYRRLSEDGNAALFQVISQRYLKSSVALTSHVGIASWADQSAAFSGDLGITGTRIMQGTETTDVHPGLLIQDHEQRSPFGFVNLAVDEPKGDRRQSEQQLNSPTPDTSGHT